MLFNLDNIDANIPGLDNFLKSVFLFNSETESVGIKQSTRKFVNEIFPKFNEPFLSSCRATVHYVAFVNLASHLRKKKRI